MLRKLLVLIALIALTGTAAGSEEFWSDFWVDKFKDNMTRAEQGDADAQYTVAYMYEKGKGVKQDTAQALSWYHKAAAQNLDKAEYKLGYLHFKGIGVNKDLALAIEWLRKAADKGYSPAQFYLGLAHAAHATRVEDYDTALKWLNTARANGFGSAYSEIHEVESAREAFIERKSAAAKQEAQAAEAAAAADEGRKTEQMAAATPPPVPVAQPKTPALTPEAVLMQGGWHEAGAGDKPAVHLPSALNACRNADDAIVCTTREMTRSTASMDITYQVETTIDIDASTGRLYLVSRNNVLKVSTGDRVEERVNIKPGWQYTRHYLDCELKGTERVICGENGVDTVEYVREGV